ncbi:FecR family protein [Chitinophaga japonensis]|uniref:FecR family protein n=1 Tax=Chitinophaga japonensis TaxID=104662 RepID=A0A562TCR2_CHIJA|nr:FecR family protein [Chitinophaga japonensis]TWI91163.1 FecR family protein [Chitinophaga japonensis]
MNIHERLAYLLHQVTNHSATDAELEELAGLLKADHTGSLTREIEQQLKAALPPEEMAYDRDYWDNIAGRILSSDHPKAQETASVPVRTVQPWRRWRWAAAAALAVLLSVAGWQLWQRRPVRAPAPVAIQPFHNDVAPGSNRAMLTLADGTQIPLDSAGSGPLAQQGNTRIIKLDSGRLAYRAAGNAANGALLYNTITTLRGGQFRIALPDGTQVWLNASSSLRYPTSFAGPERRVQLSGEAYFEVAKDADQPFRIHTKEMEVEVLGTHFNIMAYDDEDILKTTLLEGAIKVSREGSSRRLQPGQQARVHRANGSLDVLQHANTEEAVAWKNGFIQFEGQDIRAAMRMLARWYNVEVEYRGAVPAHFRGVIPRNVPLSQVLKMMEMTGEVQFSINGNKIIVSP